MIFPFIVSQAFFTGMVILGIIGTFVVGAIILRYTVQEMRNNEMW
jgi:uncharacterized membrane protein